MFKLIQTIFLLFLVSVPVIAGDYAKEANDNPFLSGYLNPKYEGESIAIAGVVLEIHPTKEQYPLYKLNLNIEGINPIWVTSIAPVPPGGLKVGDGVMFAGFISNVVTMDQSVEIAKIISGKMLLLAIQSKKVN